MQQMAFTPFVFEAVGDLIDQSTDELYLFSTDYHRGRAKSNRALRNGARRSIGAGARSFLRGELPAHFPDARAA